jgi:predicted DNA-binding transcriptional regulator YafY
VLLEKEVVIWYGDKQGSVTRRKITPKLITRVHGYPAIRAYCCLREEERTFLLSRIRAAAVPEWSSILRDHKMRQMTAATTRLKSARRLLAALIVIVMLAAGGCIWAHRKVTPASVHVSGYVRSDGRRVSSYSRRPPSTVAHDAPYAMLRFFCLAVLVGGGLWAWATREHIKHSRHQMKRLSQQ